MARISVYIPDELLERARGARSRSVSGARSGSRSNSVSGSGSDSEKTSQLIQRALQRLVDDEERLPGYAQSPEHSSEQIAQLRDRLLTEARQDYERGYAIALEAASGMSLHTINALVDDGFDLGRWLEPYKNGYCQEVMATSAPIEDPEEIKKAILASAKAPPPHDDRFKSDEWWWLWKTAEALGNVADPITFDRYSFTPTKARQRGYIDAMRTLWAAVEGALDDPRPIAGSTNSKSAAVVEGTRRGEVTK